MYRYKLHLISGWVISQSVVVANTGKRDTNEKEREGKWESEHVHLSHTNTHIVYIVLRRPLFPYKKKTTTKIIKKKQTRLKC